MNLEADEGHRAHLGTVFILSPTSGAIETGAGDHQRERMCPKLVEMTLPLETVGPMARKTRPEITTIGTNSTQQVSIKWVHWGSNWLRFGFVWVRFGFVLTG